MLQSAYIPSFRQRVKKFANSVPTLFKKKAIRYPIRQLATNGNKQPHLPIIKSPKPIG